MPEDACGSVDTMPSQCAESEILEQQITPRNRDGSTEGSLAVADRDLL
jgi:hypothetical protein